MASFFGQRYADGYDWSEMNPILMKTGEFRSRLNPCRNQGYLLIKIKIFPYLAAEMVPYDTGLGDFRVHYAGFFDPGFGDPNGSFAVLEVKTNEVSFNLEDGQNIAKLIFENLNKPTNITYGNKIDSNYQNQGLALSKHFNIKAI